MVLAAAKHKKPKTAVGPDGVSRKDLLSLPGGALESLALMFDQIEGSGNLALQLCTGFVSSLEKKQGNLDVDAFRPVTVYLTVGSLGFGFPSTWGCVGLMVRCAMGRHLFSVLGCCGLAGLSRLWGFVHDDLGCFDPLTCNFDELLLRLVLAWRFLPLRWVIANLLKGFIMLTFIAVYRMMGSVSQTELVFLRCCMDGTLFTNNARAHWQEGVSDRCPWCGAVDGNYHRAWECPGFADCRASVPDWILRYVPSLPSSFSAHAWPPLPSAWLSCLGLDIGFFV